jgi:hypothetical protein
MEMNTVLQVELAPAAPSNLRLADLPAAFHEFFDIEER